MNQYLPVLIGHIDHFYYIYIIIIFSFYYEVNSKKALYSRYNLPFVIINNHEYYYVRSSFWKIDSTSIHASMPDYNKWIRGMAGFSHFGSEWGKTVSQPTLLIVIIVKKDYLCAAQVNSFISGNLAQMTHPRIVLDHLCFKGMIFQISCC